MGSVNVSQVVSYEGYSSEYAYATISWNDAGKVTVTLTSSNILTWRIRGKNPDTKEYLVVTGGGTTGTFTATIGTTYYFQIYSQTYGKYSDGAAFTVSSDDDSGGSSGGSSGGNTGGSSGGNTEPIYLWIHAEEGTTITVNRLNTTSESESQGSYTGELTEPDIIDEEDDSEIWYGFKVWWGEYFKITANALDGYTIDTYELNPDFVVGYDGTDYTFNFETEYLSYYNDDTWGLWVNNPDVEPWIYSSATPNEYKLSISESVGSHVKVTRKSSKKSDAALGVLNNGDAIYYSDTLEISVSLETGYDIIDTIVTGCTENKDGTFTVTGDTNVTVVTELMGIVYIDNGTTFVPCLIFIDNGSDWEQCIPYIDNGTSWVLCS